MKCSAIIEIAQMVETKREVWNTLQRLEEKKKKKVKRRGKAIFKKCCFHDFMHVY